MLNRLVNGQPGPATWNWNLGLQPAQAATLPAPQAALQADYKNHILAEDLRHPLNQLHTDYQHQAIARLWQITSAVSRSQLNELNTMRIRLRDKFQRRTWAPIDVSAAQVSVGLAATRICMTAT